MGDGFEHRHKDQSANAHNENNHTETMRNLHTLVVALGTLDVALKGETDKPYGNSHTCKTCEEGLDDDVDRGHLALDPEHDSCNIADGTPGAAGIGGKNHHTGIEPALLLVGDKLAQQSHHNDCRRHIVEQRREEEGQD